MRRSSPVRLSHFAIYCITMFILMVLLPLAAIKLFPVLLDAQEEAGDQTSYNVTLPKTVHLYITAEDTYKDIPFEDYVEGVVAAEMPSSFELEALKAQAVASRTYALGRILADTQLCDSVHCQVYRSDGHSKKVRRAAAETCGQVLLYNGELAAHSLYFASSGGNTENAQDVFSGSYDYLVSVDSSYEPGATHKKETLTMSVDQFAAAIKKALPDLDFGNMNKSNIRVTSVSAGGRAEEVQVGDQTISGSDIRSALNLYSTRMEFDFEADDIIITTSGSGHGVGMSQYGANGLAKKGMNYQEILAHYYQGTEVSKKK